MATITKYVPSESKLLNVVRRELLARVDVGATHTELAAELDVPTHRIRTFLADHIKYPRVHDVEHAYTVLTGKTLDV